MERKIAQLLVLLQFLRKLSLPLCNLACNSSMVLNPTPQNFIILAMVSIQNLGKSRGMAHLSTQN